MTEKANTSVKPNPGRTGLEIAVIGMSGRFPGANNINRFWENLQQGIETISFFSDNELEQEGIGPPLRDNPDYVRAKGIFAEIDYFDADFFAYTPKEAEIMDPQIRLFHECVWETLEDAGYDPGEYHGLIGLYAGASPNTYWEAQAYLSGKNKMFGTFAALFNNDKDFLTLLVSYKLNLKGPVISFFTTCSTSLVAIHLGCRALLTGECHMALAGGVAVNLPQKTGYLYQEGMVLSADGHCRAFDRLATGTMGGDGVGVVLLKPLAAAAAEGDHIYAVIKGSAVNNDGDRRVGFTAPSISGQAEAIKRALHMAEVEPGTLHYIETHGTATPLGDPVEIEALKMALKSDKTGFCGIGSVKSNVGHLDCAAGIAGFIKAVLILEHKVLPPSLHFEHPNPKIDFNNSPFYVNHTLTPLTSAHHDEIPLRVGVSSFGIGGTNAHVILEEGPKEKSSPASRPYQLIVLSARTRSALAQSAENLARFLKTHPQIPADDLAYTLQLGRKHFPWRRKLVCADLSEAIAILTTAEPRKIQTFTANDQKKTVVFMFPGLGAQYVNMGRQLYEQEPLFREELDRCVEILNPLMGCDIKEILYPSDRSDPSDRLINKAEIAQPVLFAFEYALARLLLRWGIKPTAMIGYSLGEYTAACLAEVFSLEEALKLIVKRVQLINDLPAGGMLSIPLPKVQIEPLLEEFSPELGIGVDNGPSCIVSGSENAVAALETKIKKMNILGLRLNTSHGIHSNAMTPILEDFNRVLAGMDLKAPQIPYISNVTGTWIKPREAVDPHYWTTHLKKTVRFAEGISRLLQEANPIFIEVGPDRDLCTLLANQPGTGNAPLAVNLVKPPQSKVPDLYYLLSKIGQCWLYGIEPHWPALYPGEHRHRLSLPVYPFERQYYPVRFDTSRVRVPGQAKNSLEEKKPDLADWFYYPSWRRSQLAVTNAGAAAEPGRWLVFAVETEFSALLIRQLKQLGHEVITVMMGKGFSRVSEESYILNPGEENDYPRLLQALGRDGKLPPRIVHTWTMAGQETGDSEIQAEDIETELNRGFYSVIYLAKALGKQQVFQQIQLQVITRQLQEVTGAEAILPQIAPILGPLKVIPQEYPFIRCKSIDLPVPEPGTPEETQVVEQLLTELSGETPDTDVAYRNHFRWTLTYRPLRFEEAAGKIPRLKEGGVYLLTGGLGKIALTLARYLVERWQARLILVGHSELPGRDQWERHLAGAAADDITARKIRELKQLEEQGGQLLIFSTDVTDRQGMEAVIAQAEARFGAINGVIHAAGHTRPDMMRSIEHLTVPDCQQQFMPKIYGILTLEKILKDKKLDFCWLTSSLSPLLGGLGLSAYAAANHFMDAFVKGIHHRQRSNPGNPVSWISVNWADWDFSRVWEPSPGSPPRTGEKEISREGWWMLPHEGVETFRRILCHCTTHQVAVSTVDLQTRLDRWVTMKSPQDSQSPEPTTVAYRSRPQLETGYVKPANQIEQTISEILQDFLGIEDVGTQDNFFELGATSLNIIQINGIVREKLQQDLSVMWWFEHPTIKTLAGYLLEQGQDNPAAEAAGTGKEEKRAQSEKKGKSRLEQLKKRVAKKN